MLTDASIYDDNMTLLQAYKKLEKRVKALEANGGGGGGYVLPVASETTLGGIKVGQGLGINGLGYLYTTGGGGGGDIPVATSETLGGVKIGDNVAVSDDGTISVANTYTDDRTKRTAACDASFLFGFKTGARVGTVDITTPFVFTNENDLSDTKTLYLPQNALTFADLNLDNASDSMMLNVMKNYGDNMLNLQGQGSNYFKLPHSIRMFDSITEQSGSPAFVYVEESNSRIALTTGDELRYYVNYTEGAITKLVYDDWDETIQATKRYRWTGNFALNTWIPAGQGTYASLYGLWIYNS